MSKTIFGSTSWSDTELSTNTFKEGKSNKDAYLRLENGSNVVRIVTKPHEYLVHRIKFDEKDPGFGERVMSSMFHGSDPCCEPPFNSKPKRRWLVGVIDRKTGSYKILDMSTSVFKGIQDLAKDDDWGDPSQYDCDVKVNKAGGPSNYYSVIPKSKKPLSTSDLEIKQNIDLEELKRKCTPPTREQVEARLASLRAKKGLTNTAQTSSTTETTPKARPVVEDDNSDDFEFPAVEGSAN